MRYPRAIQEYLQEIYDIVEGWPINKNPEHVVKWLLQFDAEDLDLAMRVLRNLVILGNEEINQGLEIANSKLHRKAKELGSPIDINNTIFAGVGEGGKSGWMVSYHFRMVNSIPEYSFLSDEILEIADEVRIENLVLIDDFVGSGNQASKEIEQIKKKVLPLGVKNFFMISVAGMRDGLKNIEQNAAVATFCAFEYDEIDTIKSFDADFYNGLNSKEKEAAREKLKRYGATLSPKRPLGYGDAGGLLAFHYNTPNNTLPIIWSTIGGWLPLFRRIENVPDAEAIIPKLTKSRQSKTIPESAVTTIFLESFLDEQVFKGLLSAMRRNGQDLGNVEVVALGAELLSFKFLSDLAKKYSRAVFLFKKETVESWKEKSKQEFTDKHVVVFESLWSFIDIAKIPNTSPVGMAIFSEANRRFKEQIEVDFSTMQPEELERILRRSRLIKIQAFIDDLTEFVNVAKMNTLFSQINEKSQAI